WLYATAARVLQSHQRGERRYERVRQRIESFRSEEQPDPAAELAERDYVLRAVRLLSPNDRELLLLTVWEGLDVPAAATVVGCSVGAAHVRLYRARRRLAALLRLSTPHRRVARPDAVQEA